MFDVLVNPRWLQAFVVVAEELNFTRAAERLGIAQQPLSQQIARLEREIGARLFERSTRRVSLTDAGRSLYVDAQDVLARLTDARRHALLASQGETGRVTVGCGSYAVESILPPLLGAFHDRYPGVAVRLYEGHTVEQLDALRRGEIDVAFALLPIESEDLIFEPISEGGFVVALRTQEAQGLPPGPVPLAMFRQKTFVSAPRAMSPGLDDLKMRLFEDAGFAPTIGVQATQVSTMITLVAAGVAVLLTPATATRIARNDITYVPIHSPRRATLSMVTHAKARESVVVEHLRALVREIVATETGISHT
jgi:DNA-binding transcriptional LysR family regulator